MEFEQKSFKTTATGYCIVEDGIIYEINPIYGGQKTRVGVIDAKYNELKAISDEYYNKLVELGAITPPKTPEEIQKETMMIMSGMLEEIRSMKSEMEALKNERKYFGENAGNECGEHLEAQSSVGTSTENVAGSNKPRGSKKSN